MVHHSGTKKWSRERVTKSVSCRCSKLLYQDYLYHWRGPSCHRLPAYKGTLILVHNLADTPSLGHFHFLGHLLLPPTPPSCHPLTCCFCCPLTLCCHFPPFLTYHFHPPPPSPQVTSHYSFFHAPLAFYSSAPSQVGTLDIITSPHTLSIDEISL